MNEDKKKKERYYPNMRSSITDYGYADEAMKVAKNAQDRIDRLEITVKELMSILSHN